MHISQHAELLPEFCGRERGRFYDLSEFFGEKRDVFDEALSSPNQASLLFFCTRRRILPGKRAFEFRFEQTGANRAIGYRIIGKNRKRIGASRTVPARHMNHFVSIGILKSLVPAIAMNNMSWTSRTNRAIPVEL